MTERDTIEFSIWPHENGRQIKIKDRSSGQWMWFDLNGQPRRHSGLSATEQSLWTKRACEFIASDQGKRLISPGE